MGKYDEMDVQNVEGNGGGGSYNIQQDDVAFVDRTIKAKGGPFSLPFEQAKKVFNYVGKAKMDTWLSNAQLHLKSRKVTSFHLGVTAKSTRVSFKPGPQPTRGPRVKKDKPAGAAAPKAPATHAPAKKI